GGSAGGAGCAADLPGRSGCCAARRLYPRDPLWCAARRLYPCVALRRMIGKSGFPRRSRANKNPSATAIHRAVALGSSSAGGVAVRKAARQGQPHPRAAGAGGKLELDTTTRGAASHVAQAARRFFIRRRGAVRRQRKSLAIVFDADAPWGGPR